MTDDAHHMLLVTLVVEGVAHRLAVDRQTLVLPCVGFVPASQGAVRSWSSNCCASVLAASITACRRTSAGCAAASMAAPSRAAC